MAGPWEKYSAQPQSGPWSKYATTPPQEPTERPVKPLTGADLSLGETMAMAQGVPGGTYLDELASVPGGIATAIKGEGFQKGYQERLQRQNAILEQYRKEHPGEALTRTIVGGLGGGGLVKGAGMALRGLSLPARVGVGAGVGAATGAVQGFGEGTDTESRIEGAQTGGLFGGVGGGAIPVAGAALQAAPKAIGRAFQGVSRGLTGGPRGEAATRMAESEVERALVQRDLVSPNEATLRSYDLGDEASLVDVGGENTRELLKKAYRPPGAARDTIAKTLYERQAGVKTKSGSLALGSQASRISDSVERNFGVPPSYEEGKVAKEAFQASSAKDFGDALNNKTVTVTPRLANLMSSPAMKTAIRKGKINLSNEEIAAGAVGKGDNLDSIVPGQQIGARTLANIKRFMDDHLESFRNDITKQLDYKKPGVASADVVRKAYREEVNNINPEYGEALGRFATQSRISGAFEDGSRAFGMKTPQLRRLMESQETPQEMDNFRKGYGSKVVEMLAKKKETLNAAEGLENNIEIRDQVRLILGKEKSEAFFKDVKNEATMFRAQKVLGGSDTAANLLSEDDEAAVEIGKAGLSAARGNILSAVGNLTGFLSRRFQGLNEEVRSEMARILLSKDREKQIEVLRKITSAKPSKAMLTPSPIAIGSIAGGME